MWWAVRQLLVPMNYLRIRHGETLFRSKKVYDFVFPFIFTTATCLTFWWLDMRLALATHPVLVKRLSDLLALMIVFYMAALAAVATFERQGIDQPLKGGDAKLRVRDHDGGGRVDKDLSYRQFISYLFGYLSFLSLCLFILIIIFDDGWAKLEAHFVGTPSHDILVNWADPIIFGVFFFAIWQLIFTSLLGIYFLAERIQTLNDSED